MKSKIILVALVILATCGGEDPAPVKTQRATQAPPKPIIAPLTGVERPPGFDVSRPALAIKIDNAGLARPQSGLEHADIVYEELAEGGITRFLAVFHSSDAARVGPVRSARLVDADILEEYGKVLLGYSGANPLVLKKISSTAALVDLRHGKYGDAYKRVKGRPGPHDLFTSTDELWALSDVKSVPRTGLQFGPVASAQPQTPASPQTQTSPGPATQSPPPGSSVSFAFAGSVPTRYSYDPSIAAYLRFHGEKPHNSETNGQLHATNVVVIKVKTRNGEIRDAAGNFSPEISVAGTGEGVLLTKGVATPIKWARSSLSDNMTLMTSDGKPVTLAPGSTWIHLLPADRVFTVT